MFKSVVYEGDKLLGEVEVYPQNGIVFGGVKEIRISHYTQPSERCPPLAVLHTITSSGVCFKMEESSSSNSKSSHSSESLLFLSHSSCLKENKAAVVLFGSEELHLVAMYSRKNDVRSPCFWGFSVASGLYNSSVVMLNLRCLGIVFDLDETLIVANTMRSFEDRIDALQRKIASETDPQRVGGMMAEVKRYQDDKIILKQYAENDQLVENGKVIKSQYEVVPALSDNHQSIVRPLIRLQDRNIILTRINPLIRDTSVLVRLRPAWDDLRSYLTARGRKRFEVYVCTMAERDYALEMWRLLDPDSSLIGGRRLLDRIICVKSGSRKSLFNVFQDGNCHPKLAMVIDDRLKVWDEKDQPRVHVVPAFAPYYAPLAEENNAIPILCLARNVACNVRGGFFKEFDEGFLQRISEVAYEDDIKEIPSPPDVSNYLISEDDAFALNANKDLLAFDGLADGEVERRLKDAVSASSTAPLTLNNPDTRLAYFGQFTASSSSISIPQQTLQMPTMPFSNKQLPQVASLLKPVSHVGPPEGSLQSSPAREEGEVPESELDPDTRRRLLILQHGQDTRDHAPSESQFPARPPMQVSVPRGQMHGSWFPMEEEMSPRHLNTVVPPKEFPISSEPVHIEKHQPHYLSFNPKVEVSVPSDRVIESQRMPKAALQRDVRLRFNHSPPSTHSFSGEEPPLVEPSSGNRELDYEPGQIDADTPAGVLQDIAFKCGTKVELRPTLVSSTELQFSVEVWFGGEKIGEGIGRTRREAQYQAAEGSLMNLADKYLSRLKPDSSSLQGDGRRILDENGFVSDANTFRYQLMPKEESMLSSTSEPPKALDPMLYNSKRLMGSVSALKELCMIHGLEVAFQPQSQLSDNSGQKNEVYAQVEIDGHVLGKGVGLTWDEAKTQAAEKALGSLKSMLGQFSHKRQGSFGTFQGMPSKHLKPEFSGGMQRLPSARYSKNTSVP